MRELRLHESRNYDAMQKQHCIYLHVNGSCLFCNVHAVNILSALNIWLNISYGWAALIKISTEYLKRIKHGNLSFYIGLTVARCNTNTFSANIISHKKFFTCAHVPNLRCTMHPTSDMEFEPSRNFEYFNDKTLARFHGNYVRYGKWGVW